MKLVSSMICVVWITVSIVLVDASKVFASAMVVPTSTSSSKIIPDAGMAATYNRLAQRAIDLYNSGKGTGLDGRCWIGIAGGPGAGKSTLAAAVAEKICNLQVKLAGNNDKDTEKNNKSPAIQAIAIPMDGYHFTRKDLANVAKALGDDDGTQGMSRRGAPWTFDAKNLAKDLATAKATGKASLPEYDRKLSDPVPNAVTVEESHQIILVEGNYLILGLLGAEVDPETNSPLAGSLLENGCSDLLCPIPIGEEILRWRDAAALWDETWFVAPPGRDAVETQRDRIIERSLETWNPSKTKAWGGSTDREAAVKRAEFNDVRNAKLVECCRSYADLIIDSI